MYSRIVTVLFMLLLALPLVARGRSESTDQPAGGTRAPQPETESRTPVDPQTAALLEEMGMIPFSHLVPVENFVRPALAVETRSLEESAGRYVLVNFWASWCAPCREEMPSMQTLYDAMDGTAFEMLAVNVLESREVAAGFIDEFGFTFPVLLDRDGGLAREFGVRGYPSTYLLDADGAILGMRLGFHDWSTDEVIAAMRELVATVSDE